MVECTQGAMMSGFQITSMILTSRQTYSVHFDTVSFSANLLFKQSFTVG